MNTLLTVGFIEELRDDLAANSGLGYVTGTNLFVGQLPDPPEHYPEGGPADRTLCALYEEGETLIRSGSRHFSQRTIRFVHRGDHPQDALNRARAVHDWYENNRKHLVLTTFSVRLLRVQAAPAVFSVNDDATVLASFALLFHVMNRVT